MGVRSIWLNVLGLHKLAHLIVFFRRLSVPAYLCRGDVVLAFAGVDTSRVARCICVRRVVALAVALLRTLFLLGLAPFVAGPRAVSFLAVGISCALLFIVVRLGMCRRLVVHHLRRSVPVRFLKAPRRVVLLRAGWRCVPGYEWQTCVSVRRTHVDSIGCLLGGAPAVAW